MKEFGFMQDVAEHYKGKKGQSYFSGRFDSRHNFGRVYQTRYFAPYCHQDQVLLDYGCGDGTMLRHLPASKRIGIEVNEACIERIRAENADLEIPIEVYSSLDDVPDDSIDVAISNHALEHVPSPLEALQQIKRVLRPGGPLILVIPFDDWRCEANRTWKPDNKDHHLFTWAPVNIGNLLSGAGFVINTIALSRSAWSPKSFWVHDYLGRNVFDLACRALSRITHRAEILCHARKPGCESTTSDYQNDVRDSVRSVS